VYGEGTYRHTRRLSLLTRNSRLESEFSHQLLCRLELRLGNGVVRVERDDLDSEEGTRRVSTCRERARLVRDEEGGRETDLLEVDQRSLRLEDGKISDTATEVGLRSEESVRKREPDETESAS
jgi:hypothetical protein